MTISTLTSEHETRFQPAADDDAARVEFETVMQFDFFGHSVVRRLVRRAAEITGVPAAVIMGPAQKRYVSFVRFGVIFVARQQGRTFEQIGQVLNRDHTTILHAERRARRLINDNPEFARYCATLEER